MSKLSVLELMKKNYNASLEAIKLKQLFFDVPMFQKRIMFANTQEFTYAIIFDSLLLRQWKFRQTYISTKDILIQNHLDVDFAKKYTNEQLVDFIELIDNLLYYKPKFSELQYSQSLYLIKDRYTLMLEILEGLIKNLGLEEKKSPDGWIALIPRNETLDKVIEDFKPAVQWEIISYLKIKQDDLETKRKHLAYLATELYIEKDKNEQGYKPFEIIINECTLILNNLHIRHNNETGKWENDIVKNINMKEALEYCDLLYNKMLQVVLMRKDLKDQSKIDKLSYSLKNKS